MAVTMLQQLAIWCLFLAPISMLSLKAKVTYEGAPLYFKERNSTFDWRTRGVISPVSMQGPNMAAWDEAARESLESLLAIQTGKLVQLSTEELHDCCPFHSFQCVLNLGGLCSAADYGKGSGNCHNATCPVAAKVTAWNKLPPNREDKMHEAILTSPLMAGLDASSASFADYSSGVFDPSDCGTKPNHYLQLVGYGSQDGKDFWIAKNSWGSDWGMQGYIYIRKWTNVCGIANNASFPVNH